MTRETDIAARVETLRADNADLGAAMISALYGERTALQAAFRSPDDTELGRVFRAMVEADMRQEAETAYDDEQSEAEERDWALSAEIQATDWKAVFAALAPMTPVSQKE